MDAKSHDHSTNARRMTDTLGHRGPDDGGVWVDDAAGIAIGHRRLSILDLSCAGHQPMRSADGRYIIAFNGEIYNHKDLRRRLEAERTSAGWIGESDTETLLAAFGAWGIRETLRAVVGMFAIALWDRRDRILTLARDRMGEKPLYYGWQKGTLLFASELKALRGHPAFCTEIDRGALTLYVRHGYVPAPHSIYRGIHKLSPGSYLHVRVCRGEVTSAEPIAYWSLLEAIDAGRDNPFDGSDTEAVDLLEQTLRTAVETQRLADVPVGVFLSGGIDSSTVVALMQKVCSAPARTFTIGFDEAGYNEATHAKAIARHLGTHHTELYVRAEQARDAIPRMPEIYCEPFADSSQVPTFLLSQLTRRHVTVALSGDAGDELFGGYSRYVLSHTIWGRAQRVPLGARRALSRVVASAPRGALDAAFAVVRPFLARRLRLSRPGEQAHKLAGLLTAANGEEFYRRLVSTWSDPVAVVLGGSEPRTLLQTPEEWPASDSFEHWMMAMDARTYLPDDILVKVDRAAMANSLETRVPFLDHRVVELAWRLPLRLKIRDGVGKWIVRQVLYRHLPAALVERPKMGFGVPIDSWLRGPLRDWAESLLDQKRLLQDGYFDPAPIRRTWGEHLTGRINRQHQLWPVLMFQAWLDSTKHN